MAPPLPPRSEITPAPIPLNFGATRTLDRRQQITTISVTESASPTANTNNDAKFPFAVAIPALVGGMALAILGALLYLYMARRNRRKRREARELRHRRAKRLAAQKSANSSKKTSPTSSRKTSSEHLVTPSPEKQHPVPALPKHVHRSPNEKQTYEPHSKSRSASDGYTTQPSIDSTTPTSKKSDSNSTSPTKQSSSKPSKPSRSAARVDMAERAAASAFGDPSTRHQPRKPSPLAVKGERKTSEGGDRKWGDGPFRRTPSVSKETSPSKRESATPFSDAYANMDEDTSFEYDVYGDARSASPTSDYDRVSGEWGTRQASGEWGVALGSPANDTSLEAQQQQQQRRSRTSSEGRGGRYSGDPYLTVPGENGNGQRAKSGQYTTDPYSFYHDDDHDEQEEMRDEYDESDQVQDDERERDKEVSKALASRWNLGVNRWL